ncbi:hypothetical protein NDU88_004219 [Pleurodeles waltl]|uniref:Uncharacterized protein n=1 Tax=Pleurodeles waltl TaxID=8319 RepID=A0AAV7RKD6_PLEWA|nr:hypothetical protein NDU88_004219 [Pleurodeles waltl]
MPGGRPGEPEHVPVRSREEETIAEAGNPDIRVPDSLKREDGLRARDALKTRDDEGRGNEEGGEQLRERREVIHGQTLVEEQMNTGRVDTATGQDSPKELERRHVPGGTWLSQKIVLFDVFDELLSYTSFSDFGGERKIGDRAKVVKVIHISGGFL